MHVFYGRTTGRFGISSLLARDLYQKNDSNYALKYIFRFFTERMRIFQAWEVGGGKGQRRGLCVRIYWNFVWNDMSVEIISRS